MRYTMRYTVLMAHRPATLRCVLFGCLCLLAVGTSPGCSNSSSGGAAAGPGGAYTGGLPGQPCLPASQHEGCVAAALGGTRHVRCDPVGGVWQLVETCLAGSANCVELPDPASPTSGPKTAKCQQTFNASDGISLPDGVSADGSSGGEDDGVSLADGASATGSPALHATIDGESLTSWQFTADASNPTPEQVLVRVSSTGTAPLVLSSIVLLTDNPYLSLVHDKGTDALPVTIPVGAHVQLGVRYEPAPGKVNLAPATLRIVPAHDKSAQVKIAFTLQEKKSGLIVLCDKPGQPAIYFVAPGSKKVQQTCTLVNATSSELQVKSWTLAPQAPARGDIVNAIFGLDAYVLDTNGQQLVASPFKLAVGLKMVFAVTFYPPSDGKLAAATLLIPWEQGEKTGELSIPVIFDVQD